MSEVYVVFEEWGYDGLVVDSIWSTLDAAIGRAGAADHRFCEIVVESFPLDAVAADGVEVYRRDRERAVEAESPVNPLIEIFK